MSEKPHLMLIEARFYPDIADELVRGATAALDRAGVTHERVVVPGAFEIPAAIRYAIRSRDFFAARRRFDGYVALGCVIRGETTHYDYVCQESARALQNLVTEFTLAVGYGILTVENEDQAWQRAAVDKGNKGGQAAETCLAMIDLKRQFNLFPR
ncbi:MAG: 6,7-dimethyl-8-ribityllumazine synthase [Alphaproteobacteria bacterium]